MGNITFDSIVSNVTTFFAANREILIVCALIVFFSLVLEKASKIIRAILLALVILSFITFVSNGSIFMIDLLNELGFNLT